MNKLDFSNYNHTYFSPSSLDRILTCPRKFIYNKIGAPNIITENKGRNFGSVVHQAIEHYYNENQNSVKDERSIKSKIEAQIKRFWTSYDMRGMEKRRDKSVTDFVNYEVKRLKDKDNLNTEIMTELDLIHDGRRCIVDMVNNKDAIDWKTGTFEKFDRKMLVQGKYIELNLIAEGYKIENVSFVVLGSSRTMPLPYIDISEVEKYEKEALEIIKVGVYPKQINKYCGSCEYNLICFMGQDTCLWCEL